MSGSIHQDIPYYQHYFENRSDGGFYRKHLAGDTSCFRYPHMEAFEGAFTYREDLQYWQFSHGTGILGEYAEPLHKNVQDPDLLRRIGAEDITLYEFLVPEAKKITSNRGKKQTEIISEEPVDTEKIKAAIEATGYTYLGAESEPYKKKGFLFF